ncbi:hypothetical protein MUK42_36205 [Musa troglodytarum]|uniref:Retroviral polymerase SH3-like domain-containing protein n=1 Tax=Musa troglodytarum TaxID=320322 RepID=A0A9E7EBM0_9LILI|nr:hypothetical protein MUK42_36205 [Musa troglodytarum]
MRGSRGGHGGCPREFLLTRSRSSSKERGTSIMKRVVSRDGSSGAVGRVEDIIACGRWKEKGAATACNGSVRHRYDHEEFGYRLWNPVNKKIVRSRDVVFLEDQLFDNGDTVEKPETSVYIPWSSGPVPPPIVHDDHGRDDNEEEECGENVNDDTSTVDEVELTEQAPPPPVEIPLRTSTRERQPSTRYPPHEYVMLTDRGEPETYQKAILYEHKSEWVKAMQEEMRSLLENHIYDLSTIITFLSTRRSYIGYADQGYPLIEANPSCGLALPFTGKSSSCKMDGERGHYNISWQPKRILRPQRNAF